MRCVRNGFVLGCLVLSSPVAMSHPATLAPEVSYGSTPNRTFAGLMTAPTTIDLISIADGQEFIVTAFVANVSGGGGWAGGLGQDQLSYSR